MRADERAGGVLGIDVPEMHRVCGDEHASGGVEVEGEQWTGLEPRVREEGAEVGDHPDRNGEAP